MCTAVGVLREVWLFTQKPSLGVNTCTTFPSQTTIPSNKCYRVLNVAELHTWIPYYLRAYIMHHWVPESLQFFLEPASKIGTHKNCAMLERCQLNIIRGVDYKHEVIGGSKSV